MISYQKEPFSDKESLEVLNRYVREWFINRFDELTPPQKYTFKLINQRKNLLVTAPTGSGKTMSGFLSIISKLFDYGLEGKLEDKVYCIYISPLRALNNDIYKNLSVPLEEIYESIKKEKGIEIIKSNIRKVTIGVRTGDTSQKERRDQLAKPPNIIVTTPESLSIILDSQKFIQSFNDVEYIIVDEIHELANNKRGVHLSLSLERLVALVGHEFTRIGLGATLSPIEEAAKFLMGYSANNELRECTVVDASWSKQFDVKVICPVADMINSEEETIENKMYEEINSIITKSKTALIFTNTRSGTERVVFNLKKRFNYNEDIAAHHGSLSRESRLEVEELLKKGSLKCVVSSTSLELGVDIGDIDNVIQIGSPKSVTRAIQRIGRAGHSYKEIAKGEVLVLNRDDLVECTIMIDAAIKKHLDSFAVPHNALDVLAQHIVGMAITQKWNVDDAYNLVRRSYPYHDLAVNDFVSTLNYLAGNYVGLESRRVYSKIWYDKDQNVFGRRGGTSRVIYMLNVGTIPDQVAVSVVNTNGAKFIGSIEEEFLERLKVGDIFSLGGRLYMFEYAKGTKCYVSDAKSNVPTIPPWFSEQLPLSYELANRIGEFRAEFSAILSRYIKNNKIKSVRQMHDIPYEAKNLLDSLPIDQNAKMAIFGYFVEQLLFANQLPNNKLIVIEQTSEPYLKDTKAKNYLVFHSLYGRRTNDAISRIFGLILSEEFNIDINVKINDNGFVFITEKSIKLDDKVIDKLIKKAASSKIVELLKKNIRRTEMMKRRFRHVAARSFMILRNYKGYKATVGKQQVSSMILLKATESIDPDFPVIKETYREIMNDVMDLPKAKAIIDKLKDGEIGYAFISTKFPSPFSHGMIAFGYSDIILVKETRKYLQLLHSQVIKEIGG